MTSMVSSRPYLIRSLYEWIIDNEMIPMLVVNADYPDVSIPRQYVQEGKIVFNISPEACRGLHLENDRIVFTANFDGHIMQVHIPPRAVLAIYSCESGRGMLFSEHDEEDVPAVTVSSAPPESLENQSKPPSSPKPPFKRGKPGLKRIK